MQAIDALKKIGFDVWLDSDKIRYQQITNDVVDETVVSRLLDELRSHKEEAIAYLQASRDADSAVIFPALRANQQSTVTCQTEERPTVDLSVCSAVLHNQQDAESSEAEGAALGSRSAGSVADVELLSDRLYYLDGITEPLDGWRLWRRMEQDREYRFATDPSGTVRWERWYGLQSVVIDAASSDVVNFTKQSNTR
ncbi:MAG: hypothetical protein QXI61_06490 [Nitrososphaerota archaeon]